MLLISSAAATDVGKVRERHEDNFYLCGKMRDGNESEPTLLRDDTRRDAYLYAVCDGMGGELCGELASEIAVTALDGFKDDFDERAEEYFEYANELVCREIRRQGGRMGTTFAGLWIKDEKARAYNAGDSRIYLLRGGHLMQLSEDHTQAQLMYKQGLISKEEVKTHPFRNRLTQHIGIFPQELELVPHAVVNIPLQAGDRFLLCSDGLTDMLTEEEIRSLMSEGETPTAIAGSLLRSAVENGGRDNVTVIAVSVDKASSEDEELFSFLKDFSDWS